MSLKIIGISGTNGSGKDTVGNILSSNFDYLFLSMTESLRTEARRRQQPVDRQVLRTISSEWRRQSGLSVLVDKTLEQFKKQRQNYKGLAIASLRHPAEADRIHELGGIVLWLDAEPLIRYRRIITNAGLRNRSEEDNKSFEKFLDEEQEEMHRSGDNATLNMSAVRAAADVVIVNEFTNISGLEAELVNRLGLAPLS